MANTKEFTKADGFLNVSVVLLNADGTEYTKSFKKGIPLSLQRELDALVLANPEHKFKLQASVWIQPEEGAESTLKLA